MPFDMDEESTEHTNLIWTLFSHTGIYKDSQPTRPHENHGLAIEHLPTWKESQCKQQSKSLVVPVQGSLQKPSKIQGTH